MWRCDCQAACYFIWKLFALTFTDTPVYVKADDFQTFDTVCEARP